jgi:hydrogenase maturation protease
VLTIIGCGNTNRSDDGVGVHVAQQLQAWLRDHPKQDVRVFDAGTGGMEVMFQARGASALVIIDASQTGSQPGSIYRVPGEELTTDREAGYSLHDFRWDHALYAGRKIFRDDFPTHVTVFLIEAATLELGLTLSPPVKQSADQVIQIIREIISVYESSV